MKTLAILAMILSGALVGAAPAVAADIGASQDYMQTVGEQTVEVMIAPGLSREQREQRFGELFRNHVDIPTVGRFVLGTHWRTASEQQQQRFIQLFEAAMLSSFSRRFAEFAGVTFELGDARPEGDTDIFIAMTIDRSSGPPINTTWRLRERGSSFKILDVYVEGVSMAISLRDEYSSYIATHGGALDALLDELQRQAGS